MRQALTLARVERHAGQLDELDAEGLGSISSARSARLGPLYGFTTGTKFAFGAV
jgi:hypothetical protein